jgi:hypothetical protein
MVLSGIVHAKKVGGNFNPVPRIGQRSGALLKIGMDSTKIVVV